MVRAIAKMRHVTFTEVDICNLTAPLWTLYYMTLTLIFKVKTFSCHTFGVKIAQTAEVPGRFASTRTALVV